MSLRTAHGPTGPDSTSTGPTGPFAALSAAGLSIDTDPRRLAEYSFDASLYKIRPAAVAFVRDTEQVAAAAAHCHLHRIPLIGRGGGTSMAGNAVGEGLVLDFSRHMNRVLAVDEAAQTVTCEPGIVLTTLRAAVEDATDSRLTFAPDPSSQTRATAGGAVANDACGNHSVRYGRTSHHVTSLDVVTADGLRLTATRTGVEATDPHDGAAAARAADLTGHLKSLAADHLQEFRLELERIPRQVSGFHLARLLPEHGFDVARALVGSEGTCTIVVAATFSLVPKPPSALLLSLGYDDVVSAARDVETILEYSPSAIEGIDEDIVATMRAHRGAGAVRGLPEGHAWLYVVLDGEDDDAVAASAEDLLTRLRSVGRLVDGRVVADADEQASLWQVRKSGAGLATRLYTGDESWGGWEDSAVAPENLADYLAEFKELLDAHALRGVMYGHFGAGCMHVRITFDLRSPEGRAIMRTFVTDAARLVVKHGGSLSGEHGDGRARSELLPIMYSPTMLAAFDRFKDVWDPAGILNPGNLTSPDRLDDHLALDSVPDRQWRTSFDLRPAPTHGDTNPGDAKAPVGSGVDPFAHAVQRCVGVGQCRTESGGVMCPSYRATRDEKDSTRGRARVLQDMIDGAATVEDGWRSEEVRESLDLCLSCKACSTDCPVQVDMATYKSEFFDHYYRGRRRPLAHYSLGWLPRWLTVTTRIAPLVNAILSSPLAPLAARLGGITPHRALPRFAGRRELHRELRRGPDGDPDHTADRGTADGGRPGTDWKGTGGTGGNAVVLLIDSFTRGFRPRVAGAARRALTSADRQVECTADACCGLTWISTGQLDTAKKHLSRAASTLDDGTDRPIVVIEPSCAAAFKKDLPELVPTDAARRVSARIRSFASYAGELAAAGWRPRWAAGHAPESVTVQTHCHEYSVFGAASQRSALSALGVGQVREATGCCGVAGNFGFEPDHYQVSMDVAQQALVPALDDTAADTPVLTDGFSCLMQVAQLAPQRDSLHLAELLDPGTGSPHPDDFHPAESHPTEPRTSKEPS